MNLELSIKAAKRLPAEEIHKFRKFEYVEKRFGLKVTEADGSEQQSQGLKEVFDDLVYRLSVPRVNSISRKSLGVWDPYEKAVRIVDKVHRHFTNYSANGFDYLHYCDALYGFETNILEIRNNDRPISLEEAYILLIGNDNCHETYLVFSMLSKSSILIPYNEDFIPNATSKDCIFEVLRKSLDRKYRIPDFVSNSIHFDEVKSKFYEKVKDIKDSRVSHLKKEDVEENGELLKFDQRVVVKRKRTEDKNWKSKRTKLSENTFHKSLLNQLLIEDEYKRFHEMFEKLQFIEIKNDLEDESNEGQDIKIVFDLYPENKISTFQPKKTIPTCRIIIIKADEPFPTAGQIRKACKKQKYPVPVLVVAINEHSQISGFLYYFS
ncbi:TSEN54 family protein [Megaselia abdita]